MPSARLFRPVRRKRLKRATWPGGSHQPKYFLALLPGLFVSALLSGDLARHTAPTGLLVFFLIFTIALTGLLVRLGLTGLYVGPNHVRIRRPLRTRTYPRSMLTAATAQAHPSDPQPGLRKRRITIVLHLASGKQTSTTFAVERFHLEASTPRPLEQYAQIRGLLDFLREGLPTQRT